MSLGSSLGVDIWHSSQLGARVFPTEVDCVCFIQRTDLAMEVVFPFLDAFVQRSYKPSNRRWSGYM
jgi:hypothetical protein